MPKGPNTNWKNLTLPKRQKPNFAPSPFAPALTLTFYNALLYTIIDKTIENREINGPPSNSGEIQSVRFLVKSSHQI